jgi:hypothetical protein
MLALHIRRKKAWPLLVCMALGFVTYLLPWIEIHARYVGERRSADPGLLGLLLSPLGRALLQEVAGTQPVEVRTFSQSGAQASLGSLHAPDLVGASDPGRVSSSPLAAAWGLLLLGALGCCLWLGDGRWGMFVVPACLSLGLVCIVLIPQAEGSFRTDMAAITPGAIGGGLTRQSIDLRYTAGYYVAVATTIGTLAAALLPALRGLRASYYRRRAARQ